MNIFKLFCVDKFLFEDLPYWKKIKHHHFYFPADCKNPEEISDILLSPANFDIKVFKTRKRRRVYLAQTSDGQSILCKQMFLTRHKKDCFRIKEFACKEIINNRKFTSCPYQIPKICGYYEKRIWGFPVECGLFMSYLEGFEQVKPDDFENVQNAMIDLFRQGYFHGDLNTKNILIKRTSGEMALCDLDDTATVEPGTPRYLFLMAGNFLNAVEARYPEDGTAEYKQKFILSLYEKLPDQSVCSFEEFQRLILKISTYEIGKPIPETVFDGTDF